MIFLHIGKSVVTNSSITDRMMSSNIVFRIHRKASNACLSHISPKSSLWCWWYLTAWLQNGSHSFKCHALILPFVLSRKKRRYRQKELCVVCLVFCCYNFVHLMWLAVFSEAKSFLQSPLHPRLFLLRPPFPELGHMLTIVPVSAKGNRMTLQT